MTPIEMIFPFMSYWILQTQRHGSFCRALNRYMHHALIHFPIFLVALFVWGLGTFGAVLNILRHFEVIGEEKVGGF